MALNNHVYAVNLTNGSEKWRFPAKADNKKSFYAAPVLASDGQLIVGSYDYSLYSLNPQNGQQSWAFSEAKDKYIGPVLAVESGIYAPNSDYFLYALNSSGSLRWKFEAEHSFWASPISIEDQVFAASMDHSIYALSSSSGEQVWKSEGMGGAITTSFVYDPKGVLYVGVLGGKFSAVNALDGKTLWQTDLKGWIWAKAVLLDGTLFLGDQDGNFYAIDSQNGEILWQIQPDLTETRSILSTAVIANDTLYFATEAGILYAVDPLNGSAKWSKTIGGKIYSDLILVEDTILVAPNEFDHALIAVDLQGNTRWTYAPVK